jgi:hypothetical protein
VEKLWRNEPPRNRDITVNDLTVDTLSLAYSGYSKSWETYTPPERRISNNLDTTGNSNTAGNSTISGS